MRQLSRFTTLLFIVILLTGCSKDDSPSAAAPTPKDPNTAPKVSVDRFSSTAGHLFVRDNSNGLPATNAPINMDVAPFITQGFGPNGNVVLYYNFDVQSTTPAPIYVLFKEGESAPVAGQLNIIDVLPGETGYNDFWQVNKVTVPASYVANTITSKQEILDAGYALQAMPVLVNCPVVPDSSTASQKYGGGNTTLDRGWYKGSVVHYFSFTEKDLAPVAGMVPTSPIYVTFNINPNQAGGGPSSGFKTETGSAQTHNVPATLPADVSYSPLWLVNIYDNADFSSVSNLTTAQMTNILAAGAAIVNCPIVAVQ